MPAQTEKWSAACEQLNRAEGKGGRRDRTDVLYVYNTPKWTQVDGHPVVWTNSIYIYKKVYNIFLVLQFSPSRFLHVWESSVVVEWGSFAIHCRKPWPKLVQIWSSVYSWLKCHRYNSSENHDQHMMHNVVSFFMHLEFIPHGQTYKAQYYCKVLKHQRKWPLNELQCNSRSPQCTEKVSTQHLPIQLGQPIPAERAHRASGK